MRGGDHRKDRVEHHHGDLGRVEETEPEDHDRQERDLGHREPDRDDRVEEPARGRVARHRAAERDAAGGGDQEAGQRPVEREAGVEREIARDRVRPDAREHVAEPRQHERRHRAAARKRLPGETQEHDRDQSRQFQQNDLQSRHCSALRISTP